VKRSWTCPKCESKRVGYFEKVLGELKGGPDNSRKIGLERSGSFLGMEAGRPAGETEAFICGDCGFFEEYVKNPEALEWDKFLNFRWCRKEDRPLAKK
jgi:hypothetical protein